ncbi:stage II sporulation protein D [Paenibacillus sp. JMULE4]|uniref:stage II sporulation protein D n=1 Tax=Paenibacillus sp. JMULE4 TaxID=2518342 RepID=UPI001576646A|nr:stage II sporulation protein D [Paenibacillus sp. JMULE4]NTZ20863.1 stage II sporulation protein D [Paenibacillus sp. JMULE4]
MKYKQPNRPQKSWIRWFAVWLASFTAVVVLMPALLVRTVPGSGPVPDAVNIKDSMEVSRQGEPPWIPVYLAKEKRTELVSLEQYVRGVVAAEMPMEFELEALKAQAMAARTYILRRLLDGDQSSVPVPEAMVTDTTAHQVYVTDQELKQRWGEENYVSYMEKLNRAVTETKDIILTYQGQPIEASFFSTSNGYTENSEDYWNVALPYLRSVASPWDAKLSPRYKETITLTGKELQRMLGLSSAIPVTSGNTSSIKVIERSAGNRIKKLSINGKLFTGREVREKLGLNSSQFQWKYTNGKWEITTFGYGHGVGMSQWGANGMAKESRKAEEIVKYYYTGIELGKASNLLKGKSF